MSELKPNQMSDWHIDGVAVRTADGTGLRGCITPTHPDFPAAVEALKALVPEPFEWEVGPYKYQFRDGVVKVLLHNPVQAWATCESALQAAFEAGRRYERERGQ